MRLNDLVLEKGKTKVSWLISFHSLIRQCFNTLIRHSNVRRIWPICAFDQMRSASDQLAKRAAFDQMRNYDTIQLIDIVWHHHSLGQLTSHHWLDNIKTTVSQQYTSFVFPFAETRSVMWRQLTERMMLSNDINQLNCVIIAHLVKCRAFCQLVRCAADLFSPLPKLGQLSGCDVNWLRELTVTYFCRNMSNLKGHLVKIIKGLD